MYAVQEGHTECVELLLKEKNSIDVNRQSSNGWTALHTAAFKGSLKSRKIHKNVNKILCLDHVNDNAL